MENTFNAVDGWSIYSRVIASNYLSHREIYTDVAQVLKNLNGTFSLLDLGCGDASCLAPVLARLPITSYYGVDLSSVALDLARKNLTVLSCPIEFHNTDLLQMLRDTVQQYHVIFSSFAVHHLSSEEKTEFFQLAKQHLNRDGILLLIDAVREEGEDLPSYLDTYCNQIYSKWVDVNLEEKEFICRHIRETDFPETENTLRMMAIQAGFSSCQKVSQYLMHQVFCFKI